MFALVRTDPQAQPRHAGISFLLIDLHSPGIRIRPIKTIAGDDEFAEVFFDGVIVPAENLVGKLNDGWRIANALLVHERLGTSNPQFALSALERIKTMARASGLMADPAFQDRLAAASINVTALAAMFSHAVELTNHGQSPGPEASVVKIFGSELLQSLNELLIEAAGGHATAERSGHDELRHGRRRGAVSAGAARDDLRRLVGDPAQRARPPRPEPAQLTDSATSVMDLHLTSEQSLLRDSAAKFIAAAGPKVARAFREQDPSFSRPRLRQAADLGWLGILVPGSGEWPWPRALPNWPWCLNRPAAAWSASRSDWRQSRPRCLRRSGTPHPKLQPVMDGDWPRRAGAAGKRARRRPALAAHPSRRRQMEHFD